jgi:Trk K+ transport system NAD-binding subunit
MTEDYFVEGVQLPFNIFKITTNLVANIRNIEHENELNKFGFFERRQKLIEECRIEQDIADRCDKFVNRDKTVDYIGVDGKDRPIREVW